VRQFIREEEENCPEYHEKGRASSPWPLPGTFLRREGKGGKKKSEITVTGTLKKRAGEAGRPGGNEKKKENRAIAGSAARVQKG